jgi:hypothetical protein
MSIHPSRTPRRLGAAAFALLVAVACPVAADQVTLTPIKDNTLYERAGGTTSNGAGDYFFTGRTAESERRRGLLAFDVAGSIPAGSTINSVTLTLHMSKTHPPAVSSAVSLQRLTRNWGEGASNADHEEGSGAAALAGDATWSHAIFSTIPWTTQGGDFVATASGAVTVLDVGHYTWSSTPQLVSDVQGWLDVPANNFGWIIRAQEIADQLAKRFDSRTNPVVANRPRLTVDFTTPMTAATRKTWGQIKRAYR